MCEPDKDSFRQILTFSPPKSVPPKSSAGVQRSVQWCRPGAV